MMLRAAVLLAVAGGVLGAPAADLVESMPGFPAFPFKVYSGYLMVPGPLGGYDSLKIHYEFHESQRNPQQDPVVTWHQGGPGGSSMYGAMAEMGYFQANASSTYVNEYAWNKVANMLYLESPAGVGYSYCQKGGQTVNCRWNDTSQAEAYSHTLKAFFASFPEFKGNSLYLTGESYAGQYIPNIAYYILNNMPTEFNFKGIAVGNGCWGGDAHTVQCNGPSEDKMDAELFYGKGLMSAKLYEKIMKTCNFPSTSAPGCREALEEMDREVGPHNVYDVYDNCPDAAAFLERTGKSHRWLRKYLRDNLHNPEAHKELTKMGGGGGYDWSCGGMDAYAKYYARPDVQKAMHFQNTGDYSQFSYDTSGPASVTLYPFLLKKIRVLIYNGDADSCVPYIGNEEWTTSMVSKGVATEKKAWHPWYAEGSSIPAGYATTYNVEGASTDFSFITIRLAGHMVPTFRPQASLSFFTRFLEGKEF